MTHRDELPAEIRLGIKEFRTSPGRYVREAKGRRILLYSHSKLIATVVPEHQFKALQNDVLRFQREVAKLHLVLSSVIFRLRRVAPPNVHVEKAIGEIQSNFLTYLAFHGLRQTYDPSSWRYSNAGEPKKPKINKRKETNTGW